MAEQDSGWHPGTATGLGPMPGTDIDEAVRVVAGELPELPFLPQLPERGVGADLAGRAVALLVDIWAEVVPSGWRVTRRPSRDGRRGRDFLAWDLDALERHSTASRIKVAVCGPWTLGARLELPNGNRMVTDLGAMRDLAQSLAEGVAVHLGLIRTRMPGVEVVLQIDEPDLAQVLAGWLPTASGFGTVRAVETVTATECLAAVLAAAGEGSTVLDAGPTFAAVAPALSPTAVVVDFTSLGRTAAVLDPIGEWLNGGGTILAGATPVREPAGPPQPLAVQAASIREPLAGLGFDARVLARQIVPVPAGNLATAAADRVPAVLRRCRDVARLLAEGAD